MRKWWETPGWVALTLICDRCRCPLWHHQRLFFHDDFSVHISQKDESLKEGWTWVVFAQFTDMMELHWRLNVVFWTVDLCNVTLEDLWLKICAFSLFSTGWKIHPSHRQPKQNVLNPWQLVTDSPHFSPFHICHISWERAWGGGPPWAWLMVGAALSRTSAPQHPF